MNYLYTALAALALLCGVEQWGEHSVQVEWDKDKAVRKALLDQKDQQNKEALDALESQHRKDKAAATSQAGRDAVASFLLEHGLLPDGSKLPSPGHTTSEGDQGTDGTASESGTGRALEEFAIGCGQDALKVMRWQELCTRMNCEVY